MTQVPERTEELANVQVDFLEASVGNVASDLAAWNEEFDRKWPQLFEEGRRGRSVEEYQEHLIKISRVP